MIKRIFWCLSTCLIFFSCDNDSQDNIINNDSEVVMTGYKIDSQSNFSDANGNYTWQKITIGNIVNNKFFSESNEVFLNGGVSQGVQTEQNYFYSNNLLITRKVENDKKDLFYDTNQNLIGLNWTQVNLNNVSNNDLSSYYRFSHHSNNIVFVERLTLPYNDPATQIIRRSIVQFDSNNNIINAGKDFDLNGIMDSVNHFVYTNDNLTSIQKSDGSVVTFDYSNVIDNFMILKYNSYGKKVYRLLNSEGYSLLMNNDISHSGSLTSQDLLNATYVVLDNSYYKKKTKTTTLEGPLIGSNTTTTEFFFQ